MRNPVFLVRFAIFALLTLALQPLGFTQTVDSVSPSRLLRGTTTEVTFAGEDLDLVESITIAGGGASVQSLIVDDPTQIRARISVGDRAERGARNLTLVATTPLVIDDALEFAAGPVQLLQLTPAAGSRSETVTVTLSGRNLDVVQSLSLGAGITISNFMATSPVSATCSVSIGVTAVSGSRGLAITSAQGVLNVPSSFVVNGGAVSVGRVSPSTVVRGEEVTLTLNGENLDRLTAVDPGPRIQVLETTIVSPTQASVRVLVQNGAARGARSLTISSATESSTLPAAFTVNAGVISANRLLPASIRQRQSLTFTVDGANLDGVTAVDAGAGLAVSDIDSSFPSALTFVLTADDDAETGLRSLTITAPAGTITLQEALVVRERVITPPRLLITEDVVLPETEVGGRTSAVALVENLGDETETIRFAPAQGDTDLFTIWNLDDADEKQPFTPEFQLASGAAQRFLIEFSPEFRALSGVFWDITARDGEPVGKITAEGRGLLARLFVETSESLLELERRPASTVALPRLRTRLDTGVLERSVLIESVSVQLALDGEDTDASVVEVELERTTTGDEFFWGFTEVSWRMLDPAPGYYEGALVLETNRPSAARFFVRFAVLVDGEADGDVGVPADAGMDATSDAGGTDTGNPADVGNDAVVRPDTTTGVDAGTTDTLTPEEDAQSPDADSSGGGSGGGCSVSPASSGSFGWTVLLAAVFVTIRRRQRLLSNT
jgi:MYXO-CTERM domain-containing protein